MFYIYDEKFNQQVTNCNYFSRMTSILVITFVKKIAIISSSILVVHNERLKLVFFVRQKKKYLISISKFPDIPRKCRTSPSFVFTFIDRLSSDELHAEEESRSP